MQVHINNPIIYVYKIRISTVAEIIKYFYFVKLGISYYIINEYLRYLKFKYFLNGYCKI